MTEDENYDWLDDLEQNPDEWAMIFYLNLTCLCIQAHKQTINNKIVP